MDFSVLNTLTTILAIILVTALKMVNYMIETYSPNSTHIQNKIKLRLVNLSFLYCWFTYENAVHHLKKYCTSQRTVTSSKWLSLPITWRYYPKICLKILVKFIRSLSKYLGRKQDLNHVPPKCVSDELLFPMYEMSYLLLYME
jgi:hypothetical protein